MVNYTLNIEKTILGNPGASSRDDAIFLGKRFFLRNFTSKVGGPRRGALTHSEPEAFEFITAVFWPIYLQVGHHFLLVGSAKRFGPSYTESVALLFVRLSCFTCTTRGLSWKRFPTRTEIRRSRGNRKL